MPGASTVGADFKTGNSFVGVHDLHAEPVCRDTFLVVNLEGAGDGAVDVVPRYAHDAQVGVGEGREGIWEEVEVV